MQQPFFRTTVLAQERLLTVATHQPKQRLAGRPFLTQPLKTNVSKEKFIVVARKICHCNPHALYFSAKVASITNSCGWSPCGGVVGDVRKVVWAMCGDYLHVGSGVWKVGDGWRNDPYRSKSTGFEDLERPFSRPFLETVGQLSNTELTISAVDRCETVRNGHFLREPFFVVSCPINCISLGNRLYHSPFFFQQPLARHALHGLVVDVSLHLHEAHPTTASTLPLTLATRSPISPLRSSDSVSNLVSRALNLVSKRECGSWAGDTRSKPSRRIDQTPSVGGAAWGYIEPCCTAAAPRCSLCRESPHDGRPQVPC